MIEGISSGSVRSLLKYLVRYPYPEVCRHSVAALLLSKIEEDNPHLSGNSAFCQLCEAVCSNSHGDNRALDLLDNK